MSTSSFIDSSFDQLNDSCILDVDVIASSSMMQVSNPSSAASSVPNTDEEDDDGGEKVPTSYKQRRREAHTQAEKKRRDAIRKGYEDLQVLVPNLTQQSDSLSSQKMSKAVVLQRTLTYMEYLQQQKKKQTEELNKLKKEKVALAIMKVGYEQIVKEQSIHSKEDGQISEEVKFKIFQELMEKLFEAFKFTVSTEDFQKLSYGVINWIEEECKPQTLRSAAEDVLENIAKNVNMG